jgi:hypothetical protein
VDWKAFRQLREIALERFCERVLQELDAISRDVSRTQHERYVSVFGLLQDRDDELGRAFNNPRRSQMILNGRSRRPRFA